MAEERAPHRLMHRRCHCPLVGEAHLAFGRVDVHIDSIRRQRDGDHADRVASYHQQRVVRLLDRSHQRPTLDPAAVDQQEERLPVSPCDYRQADRTVYRDLATLDRFQRHDAGSRLRSVDTGEGIDQPAAAWCREGSPAIDDELHADIRPGQCQRRQHTLDICRFGRILPQEPPPGWNRREEVTYRHDRTDGHPDRLDPARFAEADAQPRAVPRGWRTTGDLEVADRADRCQRLAAEPIGRQARQIREVAELGGRVSFDR
ncbi:hypothetical protein HRbin27_00992 [bacterium HR27]|nr:hypothetical protein HRbin27_00992 [bacterium HR27]